MNELDGKQLDALFVTIVFVQPVTFACAIRIAEL